MLRLILSGMLDRVPALTPIRAAPGRGAAVPAHRRPGPTAPTSTHCLITRGRDSRSFHPPTPHATIESAGTERLPLGSDFPFRGVPGTAQSATSPRISRPRTIMPSWPAMPCGSFPGSREPRRSESPGRADRSCARICARDAAGQVKTGETQRHGYEHARLVGPGHRAHWRLHEFPETGVVVLITQRSQVQILPPLPSLQVRGLFRSWKGPSVSGLCTSLCTRPLRKIALPSEWWDVVARSETGREPVDGAADPARRVAQRRPGSPGNEVAVVG